MLVVTTNNGVTSNSTNYTTYYFNRSLLLRPLNLETSSFLGHAMANVDSRWLFYRPILSLIPGRYSGICSKQTTK